MTRKKYVRRIKQVRPKSELAQEIYRYAVYEREYKKQQEKMRRRGLEMADTKISRELFTIYYNNVKADLQAQVIAGDRKGVGNVFQYIVRSQAYNTNYNVARALVKSGAVKGKVLDIANMSRYELFGDRGKTSNGIIDWNMIKNEYENFDASMHPGFESAGEYIAYQHFGSPHARG